MGAARGGFSIIEVLVAVVIASIAGIALMESASQGHRAYERALHHRAAAESVSLVALSSHTVAGEGQTDVASVLAARYTIDNDRIRDELKIHRYELKTQRPHGWDGEGEGNETQRSIAAISRNAIEKTTVETGGAVLFLYGLTGEGW